MNKAILSAFSALLIASPAWAADATKTLNLDTGRANREFVMYGTRGASEYITAYLFVNSASYTANDLDGYIFYSTAQTSTSGVYIYSTTKAAGSISFQADTDDMLGLSTNSSDYPITYHCEVVLTNATQTHVWNRGTLILEWSPAMSGAGVADTSVAMNLDNYTFTGTLPDANIPSTITRDAEWDTRDEVEAVWSGVTTIWADDNDGTGSGLDADLLDGVESSLFLTNVAAGTGITVGGTGRNRTVSLTDGSSQASVDNSSQDFIQDITLDAFGRVTSLTSATASGGGSGTITNVTAGDYLSGGGAGPSVTLAVTGVVATASIGSVVQAYDAQLDDLADGTLSASAIDSAITRDTEWDTLAEINAASGDTDAVTTNQVGSLVQAYDAQLSEWAQIGTGDVYTAAQSDAAFVEDGNTLTLGLSGPAPTNADNYVNQQYVAN